MRKKVFISIFILAIVGWAGYYYFFKGSQNATAEPSAGPLVVEPSSDAFTRSLQDVMQDYFAMTAAFTLEDSAKANASANELSQSIEAIAIKELKADTSIVALAASLSSNIKVEVNKIPTEKNWDEKRHALQISSDMLFDLLRTVQYKGGKVYQQFCPMAFDNSGANWLSTTAEIRNPYFGDKMLECGELKDSLQF
ncbi:MAG TPA: DUF3347 domain-containing protein [Phnomibacter sp.]|nr:DUF3347 domain-containing protein [Phnomibacter sp.]